ncbi:hypothetical protein P8452_37388 [Trifolium repens]|nr:hypothetical protein P8452_37388 [Trifolium repens]
MVLLHIKHFKIGDEWKRFVAARRLEVGDHIKVGCIVGGKMKIFTYSIFTRHLTFVWSKVADMCYRICFCKDCLLQKKKNNADITTVWTYSMKKKQWEPN